VAPEKINRQGETFLSDMYSLGGTLYHALTGHVPFEAETVEGVIMAHVQRPLTPPQQVNPAITQATSDAISITLAKSPVDRFQTYEQLHLALTEALGELLRAKYKVGQGRGWWKR
jgi:serine/threonine-protein kinase